MQKINQNELTQKLTTDKCEITAVEIIRSHENPELCSVIINDKLFSIPYIMDYNFELIQTIKNNTSEEVLLIMFTDDELPKAWADAYAKAGILEKYPQDRRLQFHAFNDMNEQFCIDRNLLWNITDEFKGTPHELTEENGSWMWHITKWYKAHLI